MNYEDYTRLKKIAEKLQRDADRLEGEVSSLTGRLSSEFGVETIEEARTVLASMEKLTKKTQTKLTKASESFENKYGDLL
jgi:hypothetical protein